MTKKDARTRSQESVGTHVTRRTVARGLAWTTPVVAVAAAAPAYAVSRRPPRFTFQSACKFSGNSCSQAPFGYALKFTVSNDDARSVAICGATIIVDDPNPFPAGTTPIYTGGCFTIGGRDTGIAFFYFSGSTNSANTPFTGSITIKYANTCLLCASDFAFLDPIPIDVPATPPGQECDCGAAFIPA